MKKTFEIIGIVLAVLIVIYFLYSSFLGKNNTFFNTIELKIRSYTILAEIDTHGGFHGDGEYFAKVSFSSEESKRLITEIENNSHWQKLPIPENLSQCISNPIDENIQIPYIENGYWILIDRHPLATNKYEYIDIFNRSSQNYSIAVFDIDSNIIYYYALDT